MREKVSIRPVGHSLADEVDVEFGFRVFLDNIGCTAALRDARHTTESRPKGRVVGEALACETPAGKGFGVKIKPDRGLGVGEAFPTEEGAGGLRTKAKREEDVTLTESYFLAELGTVRECEG